jgi:hypothetical protein
VGRLLAVGLALVVVGSAAAAQRPPAPHVSGRTLDGRPLSLEQFRGRPVFVNVWSSW